MATVAPAIPSTFNCAVTAGLPFGGYELIGLTLVYLFVVVTVCVTFIDVALKQAWPDKYLDPVVAARVKQLQKAFPLIGKLTSGTSEALDAKLDPNVASGAIPMYNKIVSQSAYIAGRSVDEDLTIILANNDAFPTVSSYCSCTVRGYNNLSTLLLSSGMIMGFLWILNGVVNPESADAAGRWALLGYIMVFLTSFVMCGPADTAVYRNANIALWSNLPLQVDKKDNPLLRLHELGIGSFIILPFLAHGYTALSKGSAMPNYDGVVYGCLAQLGGAICFAIPGLLHKLKIITSVQSNQYQIIGEIICVFASFLTYVQNQMYASAVCVGVYDQFNYLMYAAAAAPFALFIMQHYANAPTSFPNDASVVLMYNAMPVGVSGPAEVLAFNQNPAVLPVVPAASQVTQA